jgi:hypothetical protein
MYNCVAHGILQWRGSAFNLNKKYKQTQVNVVNMTTTRFYYLTMIDYQLFHLCFTFWLPFGIIVVCYVYTTFAMCRYKCRTSATTAHRWSVTYRAESIYEQLGTTPRARSVQLEYVK